MPNKIKLSTLILSFVMITLTVICVPLFDIFEKNIVICCQFLVILIISGIQFVYEVDKKSVSLMMMQWLYIFFFMGIAGSVQYAYDDFSWNLCASAYDVLFANNLIIIWISLFLLFEFGSKMVLRNKFSLLDILSRNKAVNSFYFPKIDGFAKNLFILFFLFVGFCPIVMGGSSVLFSKELYGQYSFYSFFDVHTISTIIYSFSTGLMLWFTISMFEEYKQMRCFKSLAMVVVALFLLVLVVPPLAISRYRVAAVYGGLLICESQWIRKSNYFALLIIFSLLLIFPLLNSFRVGELNTINEVVDSILRAGYSFCRVDFDSFSLLMHTVEYVDNFGVTYGRQLLGVVLFFVPRFLWIDKPLLSGQLIVESLATGNYSNVSCPLIAEAYINFGLIGIIVFSFVFFYIVKKYDSIAGDEHALTMNKALYYCSIPFLLFIMRGSLMPTFLYYCGFVFSLVAYKFLAADEVYRKQRF